VAEITAPVDLCAPDGHLNPAAVGWSRRALHTANLRGWGRTKRWEYWGIVSPEVIVGLTVSSLDYAGLLSVYALDRRTGVEHTHAALVPLARGVALPERSGVGVARGQGGGLSLTFTNSPAGTRLAVTSPTVAVTADVGLGGQGLGVVVPWSSRRFQYTLKDVGRPVTGEVRLDDEVLGLGGQDHSFAVLDHGRGKWPYSVTWNWAAGYGRVAGRRIGLQLGGAWTDGTGSTENGLFVNGQLHKIHEDLEWTYERADFTAPWRIDGPRVGVTFAPFHERVDRTQLGVLSSEVHQCFGLFTGWVTDDDHHRIPVDGVVGWAEEARNRW
jgi:hypothetical protein